MAERKKGKEAPLRPMPKGTSRQPSTNYDNPNVNALLPGQGNPNVVGGVFESARQPANAPAPGQTVDPLQYCAAVAQAMGVQVTPYTVAALKSLADGEGQWKAGGSWNYTENFNPFNISGGLSELTAPASAFGAADPNPGLRATQDPGNGGPVDEFDNWQAGIRATADFLINADHKVDIKGALQAIAQDPSSQNVQQFFTAVGHSGSFGSSSASRISFFNQNLQAANSKGPALQDLTFPAVTPGTQTNVPGASNTPAAKAPASVTGPTSSDITYPQGANAAAIPAPAGDKTWAQTEQYIRQNYPTYAWLLNVPGVTKTIQDAVTGGWDATRLQAAISQTSWWKTTSAAMQQFEQGKATTPAQYDFQTAGSLAQQKLGDITDAIKNANLNLPQGYAHNLALEALMYGWDPTQIKENIGAIAATGAGQTFAPGYETGLETDKGQYAIQGQNGWAGATGPTAKAAIQSVTDSIQNQGYNIHSFTQDNINQLAQQLMEFGWDPGQLDAAVIKTYSGGSGAQLSQSYTSGRLTDPNAYSLTNGKNGGPGAIAAQALTTVRDAIAAAERQVGSGKGEISEQQVKDLAQESMMFGWDSQQLAQNINNLAKGQPSPLSASYLQGVLTNEGAYQKGGNLYNAAQSAISLALSGAGKGGISKNGPAMDALVQEYLQQGWSAGDPRLERAINDLGGANGEAVQYLTGMQANKLAYEKGGYFYNAAAQTIKDAASSNNGTTIKPEDMPGLIQQYLEQNWNEGSPGLKQAIAQIASGAETQSYLSGVAANPQAYMGSEYGTQGVGYQAAASTLASGLLNAGVKQGQLSQDQYNTLLNGVMQQGWAGQELVDQINKTAKGTAYNPAYLQELSTRWTELQFTDGKKNNGIPTIADNVLNQVEIAAANLPGGAGVNLSLAELHNIANLAMQGFGLNPTDQQIDSLLSKYITVAPGQTAQPANPLAVPANADVTKQQGGLTANGGAGVGGQAGTNPGLGAATNAPALLQQLRTQASDYYIQPTDQSLQQWARNIAGGTQTMQEYDAYLANQAALKYPGMQQMIQQGQTPSQIASNLQTLASNTLEISPDQVNFTSNPQFQKLLDGGADGGLMTTSQAGDYLRRMPAYGKTTDARTAAAQVETAILQAWGRVG